MAKTVKRRKNKIVVKYWANPTQTQVTSFWEVDSTLPKRRKKVKK